MPSDRIRPPRRPFRAAALTVAGGLAALLAACSGSASPPPSAPGEPTRVEAPAETAVDGGTLVYGDAGEPAELNCIRQGDGPTRRICRLVMDSLLDYDRESNVVPRLAESFEASADGRTLTFRLRRGVKWHDGRPFTSRDVLYTVEQIRSPKAGITDNRVALFEPLTSLSAPDEHTVISTFKEPYALAYQAWAKTFIAPAHVPFEPGGKVPTDRAPIGTGPYRFVRWDAEQQIVLEANAEYFGGRPHLDRLVVRNVPDPRTRAVALRTGELDLAPLPLSEEQGDDPALPYRLVRFTGLGLEFIIWNVRGANGLFADARVRKAMSLALDRRAYVEKVIRGNALAAVSSFHPATWAHDPSLEPLPYDPGEAARLLHAAGWRDADADGILDTPSGKAAFTLLYWSGSPQHEQVAAIFKQSARALGVEVSLQSLEWKVLKEKVQGHSFEAAIYSWGLDFDPDPYDFFHSSQYGETGQNFGGYANAEADRLAEEGRRTLDLKARAAIYHRFERIVREEQPYTFISHPASLVGVTRRLRGLEVGPGGMWWYPSTLSWWIPAVQQAGR